jgi:hypothetical protein
MLEVNKEAITKEAVDQWFTSWEQLNELIHAAHERRDGSAKALMEQGIELFEFFIVKATNGAVHFELAHEYEVMPINGNERFAFIKMKPGQYACYRQLDELFKETKKRCARLRLKK